MTIEGRLFPSIFLSRDGNLVALPLRLHGLVQVRLKQAEVRRLLVEVLVHLVALRRKFLSLLLAVAIILA